MPLRILIIGRGSSPPVSVGQEHRLEFAATALAPGGYVELNDYDFVFQHLGPTNPEARDAIGEWSAQGFESKIIAFTGGILSGNSGVEGVALMGLLSVRRSIVELPWYAVPDDFDGTAQDLVELLEPHEISILVALAILCQGYLVVHASLVEDVAGTYGNDVDRALVKMAWPQARDSETLMNMRQDPDLHVRAMAVQNSYWWLESLGVCANGQTVSPGVWASFRKRLERDCGGAQSSELPKAIGALMEALVVLTRPVTPDLVARAYLEIDERLAKK